MTEHPLPPSLRHLTAFIAHCYVKGLAASTTRTFISSLSFIFQLGNYQDISQTFLIKKMLKGFHKSKPTSDPRLPITPEILSALLHSLEHTTSSFFTKLLLKAMFILAFCAFLRIGEITKTANPTQHFLLYGNVSTGLDEHQNGYVEINIPHFKHAKLTLLPFVCTKTKTSHVFAHTNQCLIILKLGNTLPHLIRYFLSWIIPLSLNNTLHNNFVLPFHFAISI